MFAILWVIALLALKVPSGPLAQSTVAILDIILRLLGWVP